MTVMLDKHDKMLYIIGMNKLPSRLRAQVLHMLCEGSSIRSTSRVLGVNKNTVIKLLTDAGRVCGEYQDRMLRGLTCQRIQVDEIWSFVYAKKKNVPNAKKAPEGAGDAWTWTAIDSDSKLIVSWLVGGRDGEYAAAFIDHLCSRLVNRVQLTSDGHKAYLKAIDNAFGDEIDYAMLIKLYGKAPEEAKGRYSPARCIGINKKHIAGMPDDDHISTSYIERQNLTMRMHMRRFTRLTNAFSKKVENHAYAIALHFMFYNFVRIHTTLQVTPAMEAGVTKRLWEMSDIVALLEAEEATADRTRGHYKRRT